MTRINDSVECQVECDLNFMRTKHNLIILFVLSFFNTFAQKENPLMYLGKIGKLKIEMSIMKHDFQTGKFQGKYRYNGKEAYLNLSGTYYSPCLHIEESYQDKITGDFYLEIVGDSLIGYWKKNKKVMDVKLGYKSGDKQLLSRKLPEDYANEVSSAIQGTYENHLYFINDYWLPEELEIGYNGAKATIKIIDEESIEINFEAICGPTYHFATGSGIAVKEGDEYIYRNEDGCEIKVIFTDKAVKLVANNSMDCGFGARAFLDHEFLKISDEVEVLSEY